MRSESLPRDVRCFEPLAEVNVSYGHLPHWHQAGTICFMTWRTWDSMPSHVLDEWIVSRDAWLREKGIDTQQANWRDRLAILSPSERCEFRTIISDRWDANLECGYGSCPLANPTYADVVAKSLRHFDGERYCLSDFVIMPNHIHLLAAFVDERGMTAQCESWKHFSAVRINRLLKRTGRFWETESFDHLVRSNEQYEYLRRYIAANPQRAKLKDGQFILFQRGFTASEMAYSSKRDTLHRSRSERTTIKAQS